MIAPLQVKGVVPLQPVHDQIRRRSPVIDVSQNVQMIDNQPLDQLRQCNDEILRLPQFHDCVDNCLIVSLLVQHLLLLCDQLLNDICIVLRQHLAHLGARILGRYGFAHLNQPIQRNLIPVLDIVLLPLYQLHLFLRIVNERCKRCLVRRTQRMAEYIINFLSDGS